MVWNWSRRVRLVVRTRESFWGILAGGARGIVGC